MARKAQSTDESGARTPQPKRSRVSQTDVPRHTLAEAMRVAEALNNEFAKRPTKPFYVADAMGVSASSSRFRTITGAAVAYGLTNGAYNASEIALTELGRRAVSPTSEGDDLRAKREALMRPRVIREFLTNYSDHPLPSERIARNVLEELGVDPDATGRTFTFIVDNAREVGFLKQVGAKSYVDLQATAVDNAGPTEAMEPLKEADHEDGGDVEADASSEVLPSDGPPDPLKPNRRVFITHGRNRVIVDQLKELLAFGDFEPVISVESQSVSKPVPDKVLDEMRSCSAAIIHVGGERKLLDEQGKEHRSINENVLIEIGASMALYSGRFILLVEEGVTLPSNLQGLYEVRYAGERLEYEATMRLLKAFNEFKEQSS
jgi:predicted nucleotide-binding protein